MSPDRGAVHASKNSSRPRAVETGSGMTSGARHSTRLVKRRNRSSLSIAAGLQRVLFLPLSASGRGEESYGSRNPPAPQTYSSLCSAGRLRGRNARGDSYSPAPGRGVFREAPRPPTSRMETMGFSHAGIVGAAYMRPNAQCPVAVRSTNAAAPTPYFYSLSLILSHFLDPRGSFISETTKRPPVFTLGAFLFGGLFLLLLRVSQRASGDLLLLLGRLGVGQHLASVTRNLLPVVMVYSLFEGVGRGCGPPSALSPRTDKTARTN